MDKIIIHKNKGEIFECQFKIDGAAVEDTSIRLCLEFSNNKNMFFYGVLKEDGTCTVDIPTLKELNNQQGKLVVEAIADSTYFKLYEAEVDIKNSVEVSVIKKPGIVETVKTNIKLEQISVAEDKKEPEPIVNPFLKRKTTPIMEEEEVPVQEPVKETPKKNPYNPAPKQKKSKVESKGKLTNFDDYLKRKR